MQWMKRTKRLTKAALQPLLPEERRQPAVSPLLQEERRQLCQELCIMTVDELGVVEEITAWSDCTQECFWHSVAEERESWPGANPQIPRSWPSALKLACFGSCALRSWVWPCFRPCIIVSIFSNSERNALCNHVCPRKKKHRHEGKRIFVAAGHQIR